MLLALLLAVMLAGCAVAVPEEDRAAGTAGGLPDPPAGGEFPAAGGRASDPGPFPEAQSTPEATLRHAALLAGNWTSANAPDRFRRLADLSAGDARAEFERIAAGARSDVEQATRARATVEAVAMRSDGAVRHAIAVTRHRFASPELPALAHEYKVTLATLERRAGRWVIVEWSPQP